MSHKRQETIVDLRLRWTLKPDTLVITRCDGVLSSVAKCQTFKKLTYNYIQALISWLGKDVAKQWLGMGDFKCFLGGERTFLPKICYCYYHYQKSWRKRKHSSHKWITMIGFICIISLRYEIHVDGDRWRRKREKER